MRWVIPALLVLLIGVVIVALARQDPGYVMIQFRGWTVETSLLFTVIALSAGFLVLYVVIRLFAGARRLAPWFLEWRHQRRQRAALRAISLGFLELEEGQWRRAERRLISHLDADGGAVLAWLGAARAAHELGADQRRDDYLKQAGEHMPKAEVARRYADRLATLSPAR